MNSETAKALDEALALTQEALGASFEYATKAAEMEGKLAGEKVLLEKVASLATQVESLTKKAEAVINFDPATLKQAATIVAVMSRGETSAEKIASAIQADPNFALQLVVKVAGSLPQFRAHLEGGGVKAEKPTGADERWV